MGVSPSLLLLTLLLPACGGDKATEVQNAGECSDGADNDADGAFDCDGAPDCNGDTGNADTNAAPSGVAIAVTPTAPGPDDALELHDHHARLGSRWRRGQLPLRVDRERRERRHRRGHRGEHAH